MHARGAGGAVRRKCRMCMRRTQYKHLPQDPLASFGLPFFPPRNRIGKESIRVNGGNNGNRRPVQSRLSALKLEIVEAGVPPALFRRFEVLQPFAVFGRGFDYAQGEAAAAGFLDV